MKSLYIFDLDGTLALIDHRRHMVEKPPCPRCNGFGEVTSDSLSEAEYPHAEYIRYEEDGIDGDHWHVCPSCKGKGKDPAFTPDWPGFYAACVNDTPNIPVVSILDALAQLGNDVLIWSGRSAEVRPETIDWLYRYTGLAMEHIERILTMRPEGDYTPDDKLKMQWLEAMSPADRSRLVGVFDDRDKMVRAWRAAGVTCLQVAPGNF